MSYIKKWIFLSLLAIFTSLSAIVSLNYFMDPLWTFNYEHKYNQYQRGRKDRQQKSNALYFRPQKYDTLIFGSSRTIHMNQHYLDEHTFNYAVNDMQPNEYNAYLNFAINKAKQPIKKVIIGLDFFGALTYSPSISKNPQLILNKINKPFYQYKLLLSLDTLSYSFQNIKYYFVKNKDTYAYNYTKRSFPKSHSILKDYTKNIQGDLNSYKRKRYCTKYNENYKDEIKLLVTSHPNIDFLVFTTPVSSIHFKLILSENLYPQYERWLKESVDIFPSVQHYMFLNSITTHPNNYFSDSNHAYSSVYDCIADNLLHRDSSCPNIFITLNKENIKNKLVFLKMLNTK